MKFINVIAFASTVLALPFEVNSKTSTELLLETITNFEQSSGESYSFLKLAINSGASQYTGEVKDINVPDAYKATIFLPSDKSFLSLPLDMLYNMDKLHQLTTYHVITESLGLNNITTNGYSHFETLSGEDVKLSTNATTGITTVFGKYNNKAKVIGTSTVGTISAFFIDALLQPPVSLTETATGLKLKNLSAILKQYTPAISKKRHGDYTIFVPTEEALSTFVSSTCKTLDGFTNNGLKAVLDGHIYSDSKIYADQLKSFNGTSITLSDNSSVPVSVTNKVTLAGKIDVVEPDVLVSGGVVHIIDQVLVPENIRLCKEN